MNKLFIFQESEGYCNYYIAFALNKEEAKAKVLNSVKIEIENKPSIREYIEQSYNGIFNDEWIVKEIEGGVFAGEWC